jgi:hypothetical protein
VEPPKGFGSFLEDAPPKALPVGGAVSLLTEGVFYQYDYLQNF